VSTAALGAAVSCNPVPVSMATESPRVPALSVNLAIRFCVLVTELGPVALAPSALVRVNTPFSFTLSVLPSEIGNLRARVSSPPHPASLWVRSANSQISFFRQTHLLFVVAGEEIAQAERERAIAAGQRC